MKITIYYESLIQHLMLHWNVNIVHMNSCVPLIIREIEGALQMSEGINNNIGVYVFYQENKIRFKFHQPLSKRT